MPEGGHQHRRGERARIGEAVAVPAIGIPALQARGRRGIQQRQQRGDRPARRHVDHARAGVERDRFQHGAGHDRPLRQPGALQRAALGELGVAGRRRGAASSGCSMQVDERPAERRHQVRHRRDVDQRDVHRDAADADVCRLRRPGVDDACRTARVDAVALRIMLPQCVFDDLRRPRRARRVRPACPRRQRRPWRRGARTRPSRRARRTRAPAVRTASPSAQPGPGPRRQPHPVAQPSGQREQVDRTALAQLDLGGVERAFEIGQVGRDVVAAEQRARQQSGGPRTPRRAACGAASGSPRALARRRPRAARRTTRRRSAENVNR